MQNITTWPGWQTVRKIGSGSFGTVFEIQREDFGHTYKAALKVISIPQNESDIQRVKATGMNEESVTSYFRGFVEDFVQEIKLMDNLKGDSNIVSYEDHMVIPFDEGVGWNILIRMELLKPVLQHFEETRPMEEDIIRMGIDLCRALEKCSLYGIIHRDIKPENIFVNDRGDYKLGDFGVARTAERTASGMSVKGTYSYMAPEVYKEQPYDAAVDIYSLGIVLYQYLNNGRGPFLPAYPEDIRYSDEQKALSERMNGRRIPAPVNGSRELKEAVLKAAAYDPAERYGSARELREDLERILMLNHGKGSDLGSFSDDVRPGGRTMGVWDTDDRDGRDKGKGGGKSDRSDMGGMNGGRAERPGQGEGPVSDGKKKSGIASETDKDTPEKIKTDPEGKKKVKTGPEKKIKARPEKKKRNLFMILGAAALVLIVLGIILLPKLLKSDEDKAITTAEGPSRRTTGPDTSSAEQESETDDHSEGTESGSDTIIASGAYGPKDSNIRWKLNERGELVLSGSGETMAVSADKEVPWKDYLEQIRSLKVEEGITSIGARMFRGLSEVTEVQLPGSLEKINAHAFRDCKGLTDFTIPAGVTSIHGTAFCGCDSTDESGHVLTFRIDPANTSFKVEERVLYTADGKTLKRAPSDLFGSYTVPSEVKVIGTDAFCSSGISEIVLHSEIETVEPYAFCSCERLSSIVVDKDNEQLLSRDSVLFSADGTKLILCAPLRNGNSYTIPSTVREVSRTAFTGTNLSEIIFPESVEKIGDAILDAAKNDLNLYFEGDAPEMPRDVFSGTSSRKITVNYNAGKEGWDELISSFNAPNVEWIAADGTQEGTSN